MITVKDAAKIAIEYVIDVVGRENVIDPGIEEVDQSDDGLYWLVTVGFNRFGRASQMRPLSTPRVYKQVKVQMSDGAVRSMRMRVV